MLIRKVLFVCLCIVLLTTACHQSIPLLHATTTFTSQPALTTSPTLEPKLPPILAPTVSSISTPKVQHCEETIIPRTNPPIFKGSILYSDIAQNSQVGLWKLSASNPQPKLIYAIPEQYRLSTTPLVSPTGDKIAWTVFNTDQSTLVIYDLLAQQTTFYDLDGALYLGKQWDEENHIVLYNLEKNLDTGVKSNFMYFNPLTQEKQFETFQLPQYLYFPDDKWDPFETFFAPDPSINLALFTAFSDQGTVIVLYNLRTQQEIWSESIIGYPFLPEPNWSPDGSHAVLSSFVMQDTNQQNKLFILSRDGQFTKLITTFNVTAPTDHVVRFMKWSPDSHYLLYVMGKKQSPNIDGTANILHISTSEITTLCNPFNGQFLDAIWIDDVSIFYAIELQNGQMQYWLHSIYTGKSYLLADTDEFIWFPSLIWTPLELP